MSPKELLPDLYVFDALANDIENLDGILRTLNGDTVLGWHRVWGRRFERGEIIEALARTVAADAVRVYLLTADGKSLAEAAPRALPPSNFDDAWFGLTIRGRIRHDSWEPDLEGR